MAPRPHLATIAVVVAMAFAALYWVHDEPLLRHLGAVATTRRFGPTLYRHEAIREALDAVIRDPESARANRLSVLLGNHLFPQSMTVTHVLWAMFGILPVGAVQSPHRHQSVAVDLVVDAKPGCYTMVGRKLAADGSIADGSIADGERFDWEPHSVFITPPASGTRTTMSRANRPTSSRSRMRGSTPTCERSPSS
jgi:gentisate 1,2-dioxygenase